MGIRDWCNRQLEHGGTPGWAVAMLIVFLAEGGIAVLLGFVGTSALYLAFTPSSITAAFDVPTKDVLYVFSSFGIWYQFTSGKFTDLLESAGSEDESG